MFCNCSGFKGADLQTYMCDSQAVYGVSDPLRGQVGVKVRLRTLWGLLARELMLGYEVTGEGARQTD